MITFLNETIFPISKYYTKIIIGTDIDPSRFTTITVLSNEVETVIDPSKPTATRLGKIKWPVNIDNVSNREVFMDYLMLIDKNQTDTESIATKIRMESKR